MEGDTRATTIHTSAYTSYNKLNDNNRIILVKTFS